MCLRWKPEVREKSSKRAFHTMAIHPGPVLRPGPAGCATTSRPAGPIYLKAAPAPSTRPCKHTYELLMQNTRGLEQVDRGDNQPASDAMIVPIKADAGPARRQPRAERSRACSSRPLRRPGRGGPSSTSLRTSPRRRRGEQSQGMLKPAVRCSSRPCVVVGEELAWMGTSTVERLCDPGHNMPGSPSS